jgi:hypothetical protein
MHILQACKILCPEGSFNMRGDKLELAEGCDYKGPLPSLIEAQRIVDSHAYEQARVAEYPSIGDQLDAIWKGGDEMEEMRARIMAVKDKYPRPV